MNDELMEQLLRKGENACLDYKRDQYPFTGATDDEKAELLKDILAFANGCRDADGYILIGVDEVVGARSTVVGVTQHLAESGLQQFVNSKTNRPVTFSYRAYPFEGKQIGIITILEQDRPIYLDKNFGKLSKHVVYYRQGTTTAIATPDDIANWRTEQINAEKKKEKVTSDLSIQHFQNTYVITVEVLNRSDFPIPIVNVSLDCVSSRVICPQVHSQSFQRQGKEIELQPRRRMKFTLSGQALTVQQMKAICGSPKEDVWISICSEVGEIDRISGGLLQQFFHHQVIARENLPMTLDGNFILMDKETLDRLKAIQAIEVLVYDWKLWRECDHNQGYLQIVGRWRKGDPRYSCAIHFRNTLTEDKNLHRLRLEFRKGNVVIFSDESVFKKRFLDLPPLKWVSVELKHGLHDESVLNKSDGIWACAEVIGEDVKCEWQIVRLVSDVA